MRKKHVLLVEDQAFQVQVFERIIKKITKDLDCELSSTSSGEDVLKLIHGKKTKFNFSAENLDLIILDLFLPDITGFKILEEIQKLKSPIPVIILSADDSPDLVMKATKLGAVEYISKGRDDSGRFFDVIQKIINNL